MYISNIFFIHTITYRTTVTLHSLRKKKGGSDLVLNFYKAVLCVSAYPHISEAAVTFRYLFVSSLINVMLHEDVWLLHAAIIQFMSAAQRSAVCCSRFQTPRSLKCLWQCTPHVSCFLSYT